MPESDPVMRATLSVRVAMSVLLGWEAIVAAGAARGPVDGPSGAHEAGVRQGLGNVAHQLARSGIDHLGQDTEVVAVPGHMLEDLRRPVHPSGAGMALGQPVRAHDERAFSVGAGPPADETPVAQLILD